MIYLTHKNDQLYCITIPIDEEVNNYNDQKS